jgi:hypothetical protein
MDLARHNKLLNERLEWYKTDRERLVKSLLNNFWLSLVCLSSGVLIGAVLMYILYVCPS